MAPRRCGSSVRVYGVQDSADHVRCKPAGQTMCLIPCRPRDTAKVSQSGDSRGHRYCRNAGSWLSKGGDGRRVSGLAGAAPCENMIRAHWPPARDHVPTLSCIPRAPDSTVLAGHLHPPKFSVHGSAFPHINRDQPSRLLSSLNLRFTPSRNLQSSESPKPRASLPW